MQSNIYQTLSQRQASVFIPFHEFNFTLLSQITTLYLQNVVEESHHEQVWLMAMIPQCDWLTTQTNGHSPDNAIHHLHTIVAHQLVLSGNGLAWTTTNKDDQSLVSK